MSVEYIVRQTESPIEAKVFANQRETGRLHFEGKGMFKLLGNDNRGWVLTNRVDGEFRPFSMVVLPETTNGVDSSNNNANVQTLCVLKIRDHLFFHNENFYMLGNIPEGKQPSQYLTGAKYISRLINFPFSDKDEIDLETKSRLRRHRGVPVGEIYGIGSEGYHLRIASELNDIGLPLAAASYLIYTTP